MELLNDIVGDYRFSFTALVSDTNQASLRVQLAETLHGGQQNLRWMSTHS